MPRTDDHGKRVSAKGGDVVERIHRKMNVRLGPLAVCAGLSVTALRLAVEREEIKAVRIGRNILIPHQEAARVLGIEPIAA